MAITISRLTREFVSWTVDTGNDLAESTAEVAFMEDPAQRPDTSDWEEAQLLQVPTSSGMEWQVRILVGPDHIESIDLTPSGEALQDYQAWVRITDNPERPVRKSGLITVE